MRNWTKRLTLSAAAIAIAASAGTQAFAYISQEEELAMADNWIYEGGGSWAYRPAEREADAADSSESAAAPTEESEADVPEIAIYQYQVHSGDTLYKISRAFGLTVDELLAANSLQNPNRLTVGQMLDIPQAGTGFGGGTGGERPVVQRVLSSTLTAYTAGKESTGKTPSHPAYGITRSGSKAEEGRTVAVDPSIIPLGSTVLIEGIGLRKAEDTGSAIKGARIDVFMNDLKEAVEFGVKKNVKVFVLGDRSA
ncbi:3D domain-containing protein [Paenibacillus sp. GYB003]|uniref:3D domain-containing protein n=1 Tax=Paenibacillus sp. GYB003 TaxID=2994392 RepID=UPI002F96E08D